MVSVRFSSLGLAFAPNIKFVKKQKALETATAAVTGVSAAAPSEEANCEDNLEITQYASESDNESSTSSDDKQPAGNYNDDNFIMCITYVHAIKR